MNAAISPNRHAALKLYRANLHGTGWKIESGDYAAADAMIVDARKGAKKSRDYAMLDVLAIAQADVNQLRDGVAPLA
jgi:hypothetical protein